MPSGYYQVVLQRQTHSNARIPFVMSFEENASKSKPTTIPSFKHYTKKTERMNPDEITAISCEGQHEFPVFISPTSVTNSSSISARMFLLQSALLLKGKVITYWVVPARFGHSVFAVVYFTNTEKAN